MTDDEPVTDDDDSPSDLVPDSAAPGVTEEVTVEARAHGWRLDHYLARLYPNFSRGQFQAVIAGQDVLVNGVPAKPSRRLRVNDRVTLRLPREAESRIVPEDLPIDVLHEDDAIVVLNKPAGQIVHPGKGNYRGTLAGALQFHFDRLSDTAGSLRPGIVHRLDRDTTGVLVVAKDNQVHHKLSRQFERRAVEKEYLAVTWHHIDFDRDRIETHTRVHPKHREKMMTCEPGGNARLAVTSYEVIERFTTPSDARFTFVRLLPKTGRTHQLRVHMQHLGCPIVADRLYGGGGELRQSQVKPCPDGDDRVLIARQALHAHRLRFDHPRTGEAVEFIAPLPNDMAVLVEALRSQRV
jgi:23S rRNA pseudouridine1911/1915/1917 synthase